MQEIHNIFFGQFAQKLPPDINFNIYSVVLATFAVFLFLEILFYIFLYRKPRIDEALVRTGIGGIKIIVGHGMLVMPFLHKIKSVSLNEYSIAFDFKGDEKLHWSNHETFEGQILINVQVPPENSTMVVTAARIFKDNHFPEQVFEVIEPSFRAAIREQFRTYRIDTFEFEPSTIEVRLNRSLDLIAFAFGLKMRAVYVHVMTYSSEQDEDSKDEKV